MATEGHGSAQQGSDQERGAAFVKGGMDTKECIEADDSGTQEATPDTSVDCLAGVSKGRAEVKKAKSVGYMLDSGTGAQSKRKRKATASGGNDKKRKGEGKLSDIAACDPPRHIESSKGGTKEPKIKKGQLHLRTKAKENKIL